MILFLVLIDDVGFSNPTNKLREIARKSIKKAKLKNWFKPNFKVSATRQKQTKFGQVYSRLGRFQKIPISFSPDL